VILALSPTPIAIGLTVEFLKRRGVTSVVDEDLLYLATHMYAVSTGKPPHERIFSLGSISGKGYGRYSQVLNRIANLGKRWGYGFVIATKIQAEEALNTIFRDFLNRLAEAINVGEDLETFLHLEQSTMLVSYEADYARILEALRLLLGIYVASISSAVFIVINMILLSFFLGGLPVVYVSFLATIAAIGLLVLLIKKSIPSQAIVHNLRINMAELRLYKLSLAISTAIACSIGFLLLLTTREPTYFLITFGLFFLIPGIVGRKVENNVKNIESFFVVFIRSLGLTYATLRNYAYSIKSILASDLGLLTKHLRKLYSRLRNGIDTRIAFLYFVGETGSETLRRGMDIFCDAIEAGGDPIKVGETLSITIQRVLNLRKQREQIARAFQGVIYVLTILIVALAEIVFTLTLILQQVFYAVSGTGTQLIQFAYIDPLVIAMIKLALIFIITFLNAFAIQFARGGFAGVAWLYVSVLLILSGVTMMLSSMFSNVIYRMIEIQQLTSIP
jgi:archaellum biogenesis protein FlaJ (TadC family)